MTQAQRQGGVTKHMGAASCDADGQVVAAPASLPPLREHPWGAARRRSMAYFCAKAEQGKAEAWLAQ